MANGMAVVELRDDRKIKLHQAKSTTGVGVTLVGGRFERWGMQLAFGGGASSGRECGRGAG